MLMQCNSIAKMMLTASYDSSLEIVIKAAFHRQPYIQHCYYALVFLELSVKFSL